MTGQEIGFLIAFGAGAASFFSPCILPLLPGYLFTLAGGVTEGEGGYSRKRVLIGALAFVAGFSLVFVLLGLSASGLGRFLLGYQVLLRRLGGGAMIILGAHMLGVFSLFFLHRERRLLPLGPMGYGSAFTLGATFAAGWTPCIGPILASILIIAGASGNVWAGGALLASYALGLAVPFLVVAFFSGQILERLEGINHLLPAIHRVAGGVLVLLGILLFTNRLAWLTAYLGV